jgi:PTH1 family peptidyl-tRNA hydrolase
MEHAHLIAGLGNPGSEYADTRHNAGFLLVERLAERWGAAWRSEKRFSARLARATRSGGRVLLCQPLTFMNASGEAVRAITDYYRVAPGRLVVVVDDADLPVGELRLRSSGGSGGHHGLESVAQHLGGTGFARLRLGIGRQATGVREITGHVLGRFSAAEQEWFGRVLTRACDQVECWLDAGVQKAMSQFNGTVTDPTQLKEVE